MDNNHLEQELMQQPDTLDAGDEALAAIRTLAGALAANPESYQGWLRLSKLLYNSGNISDAVRATQRAEQYDPLQREFQELQHHMNNQRLREARRLAQRMLRQVPGHPRAAFALAEVARLKNIPEDGVIALRHSLQQAPANLFLRRLLVSLLEQAGDYRGAISEAKLVADTHPSFAALWTFTGLLLRLGQNVRALNACELAEQYAVEEPFKLSEVALVRGQLLRIIGRREQSIADYRLCLKYNPSNAMAWWALADMKTFDFSADDTAAIRSLVEDKTLPPLQRSMARFALAKASESASDWDVSFPLYRAANLTHPHRPFDTTSHARDIARTVRALDSAALAVQAEPQPKGPTPIFIVGLPRSGSTLVEQILASHSAVEGTMEQPTLASIARKSQLHCLVQYGANLLDSLGRLSGTELSTLGQAYLDDGALFRAEGTPFFIDKQPFNFRHIGLIHKLQPSAIIVDVRRNPLDCGFSLYRQLFPVGVEFSYDLAHIAAFYNGYLKLMDHWHAVLPGRIYTLQYELLVRDPKTQVRKLLSHSGLPFEPACLEFHNTERAVRTASSEQVRQPMTSRGIGIWRAAEAYLEPLRIGLGSATLRRFEGFYDP